MCAAHSLPFDGEHRRRTARSCCKPCVWCSASNSEVLAARVKTLQATGLFTGVDPRAVTEIASQCAIVPVDAHHTLFEEGDQCVGLWILAKGRMRLYHVDPDGRQLVLKFFKAGEAVQLSAAIDGGSHGLTGTTLEHSILMFVPGPVLRETMQSQPAFARNVVDALCLMLRRVNVGATTREFLDAASRIRCALMQFAYLYGVPSRDGILIDYRLTRQDIADYVGVTTETAIRAVSQMQREGSVATQSAKIEIRDVANFARAAGCATCQFDCRAVFGTSGGELRNGR